jgi:MoaA/NifB/PqqE/SkfB family radical SAM enzyme
LIDEWAAMKVFYINVGGGEPMIRKDFFELMDYALARDRRQIQHQRPFD